MLEVVVDQIQKRKNFGLYKRLEWTTNETLQLQRLAHEELGFGTWTRTAQDHPITACGERLAILDLSDPNHPQLARRAQKSKTSSQAETSSTGETVDQGAPIVGLNHAATFPSSASTTVATISPENDSPSRQTPNTRPINNTLRHQPTLEAPWIP